MRSWELDAGLQGVRDNAGAGRFPAACQCYILLPRSRGPRIGDAHLAEQRRDLLLPHRAAAAARVGPLVSLGLGAVRDDVISRRLQKATMANTESMRVRRLSCSQAEGGAQPAAGGGVLRRRAMSFDRQQKRGPAGPAPARRPLSGALQASPPPPTPR